MKLLVNELDEVSDHDWVAEIRWFWLQIEIVNASQLSNRRIEIDPVDQEQIETSLKSISALLCNQR